jgi:hypothetical protein
MSGLGTTVSSSDGGQNTASLSDAFVAVPADAGHVVAPEGASHLSVRRSSRVASTRSRSIQPSSSNLSIPTIVDALPGGKRKAGYAYQVLAPVTEESRTPAGLSENASGPRDTATPRLEPMAGRKRAASGAASESERRAPITRHLASAADFSPTHFDEPVSDDHIPDPNSPRLVPSLQQEIIPQSSQAGTPFSSPISQNPLLRNGSPMAVQSPSPSRRRPAPFRTQDSNAAWAAAEGLLPIAEGFTAPGDEIVCRCARANKNKQHKSGVLCEV